MVRRRLLSVGFGLAVCRFHRALADRNPRPPPQKVEAPKPPPEVVVKIGQVSPLTGPQAHLGKDNDNGARLAIEEANAKGLTIGARR
jgi:branched-chain amino acid transport system substrate-binding protein